MLATKCATTFQRVQVFKGSVAKRSFGFTARPAVGNEPHNPYSGLRLKNKDTILSEIDKALGRTKGPSVEYIYVNPYWITAPLTWIFRKSIDSQSSMNPYGHSAIRYILPNGEDKVMNIVGLPGSEMVHFLKTDDYIFGIPEETSQMGSEQGGIYNRSFITVRIENVKPEDVIAMDNFYKTLKERSSREKKKDASYSMVFGPLFNFLTKLGIWKTAEKGNCAYWVSKGLVEAKILKKPTIYPKLVWIKLFLEHVFGSKNAMSLVSYRCLLREKPRDEGIVSPFHFLWNRFFNNLDKLAHVIVKVRKPSEDMTAIVKVREEWKVPNWRSLKKTFTDRINNINN